jgi:hypothetical protein
MKNQTAVDWLIIELNSEIHTTEKLAVIFQQAKAMEKEQIVKATILSHFEGARQSAKTSEEYIKYGEQYYNETYGK